ncbi:MAG: inositol monophosphatase family protein, partial [Actinomycetota bacterium]
MTRLSSASSNDDILRVLHETADAAYEVLSSNTDWGLSGKRPTQYSVDLRADAAALEVLHGAGCAVLSEESGRTGDWHDDSIIVVMDPLDGSTNASRRVPWYATALAAVDGTGHRASLVANQFSNENRWTAT